MWGWRDGQGWALGRGDTLGARPRAGGALNFLRERLPDPDSFRVWSNFTFQAEDGRCSEVDTLVTPTEVFLVEIKSHPNRIDGDAGTWVWTTPDSPAARRLKPYASGCTAWT